MAYGVPSLSSSVFGVPTYLPSEYGVQSYYRRNPKYQRGGGLQLHLYLNKPTDFKTKFKTTKDFKGEGDGLMLIPRSNSTYKLYKNIFLFLSLCVSV